MAELSALIFDVDGTLADTERDGHRVAFNRAFAAAGLDWYWSVDKYGHLLAIAGGKERIHYFKERIRYFLEHDGSPFTILGDIAEFVADLHADKSRIYQQLLQEEPIELRPGIKRLITEARSQGIRLAIASTAALPNVLALLKRSLAPDAPEWFDVIAAGDIVEYKKPAPDIYQYVQAQMGLSVEQCLVFEDTAHGLHAATLAGFKTVVTVNEYTQDQDFSEATLVVNHLGDPEVPLKVIAGNFQHEFIDLASLRELLASAIGQ